MTFMQSAKHRAKAHFTQRAGRVAVAGAAVLAIGATGFLLSPGDSASRQRALLTSVPTELAAPTSPAELGQWCIDRKAQGTAGLTTRARNWLNDCIAVFGSTPNPTGSSSPSPSASPSSSASPTPTPSSSTGTPTPTPSSTTTPPGSVLTLPRIPWEGGSAYWNSFPKARSVGWTDPNFFPISVFLGRMQDAARYKGLGINTYQAMEHNVAIWPVSTVTGQGMFVMAQQEEWTPAEVGNDPRVVSWFISDECEMGYSDCTPDWNHDNGEFGRLAVQQSYVDKVTAYNDGRFKHANFGNGITRTWWAPTTMDDHVALMDSVSADKYSYTSPDVDGLLLGSPEWPAGANPATAAAYGWQVDQMRSFMAPNALKPAWGFVETARPLLGDADARTITPNQIEGAVWSMIIHEARGISYFMHNNDPACDEGSACEHAMEAKLTSLNAAVRGLAPVINTQSYQYNFNNGTDTMLKTYQGSAYVFADIGLNETAGAKTFALPAGITGTTVEVVGESRSLTVVGGHFTDTFAAEYSHHIYKIAL